MRVVIAGAGALGTCYAAMMAHAGAEVFVLVRPERRAAYGERLRVSGLVEAAGPVRIITSGEEAGTADFLMVMTKARDTAAALDALRGLEPDAALSLQNGLGKNDLLIERYGFERVLGAACSVGASLVEPGHARLTMNVATWLGELEGPVTQRVVKLVAAVRAAGFPSWSVPDAQAVEWYKLCFLIPGSVVTALSRRTYAEMCLHPELARLWVRIMRETFAVPRALGVKITTPPSSPWRVADWLDQPDEVAIDGLREIGERQRESGPGMRPSLAQDVLAGRPTEADQVVGELVRRAQALGVPVPATESCFQLLRGIEDGFST